MSSPFGFSIQSCLICFFHSQKMAFVSEFQHIPILKKCDLLNIPLSRGYEISCACT
jgi:hypothetical protein